MCRRPASCTVTWGVSSQPNEPEWLRRKPGHIFKQLASDSFFFAASRLVVAYTQRQVMIQTMHC